MESINIENTSVNEEKVKSIRGQIITFTSDPFLNEPKSCYKHYIDGLIVIKNGIIIDVDNYDTIKNKYNIDNIEHYENAIITPGFVDCHVHYVQSPMIGSFGDTLLEWLEQYTFPTEAKYNDKEFARSVANIFFKEILAQGTTTANVFCTTFEESVDAFFEESERYNTRMIAGKVLQDRNLPENLKDKSAIESIIISEKLLNKWHKKGRQLYSIIPRFAPTSTEEQLTLAGDLYQKYIDNDVYLHTHLNEAEEEIDWVKDLFPDCKNYTDVYKKFRMVDKRSIMAHCCIMKEDEWSSLHRADCGVAHCPSSNLFLGDGIFKYHEAKSIKRPVRTGIGTDVGAGTNFSVVRQLNEAYKVAMLNKRNLSAVHSLYLATRGGAEVLHLEDKIGSIAKGYEADIAILDLKASEFIEWRLEFTQDIFEKLFILFTISPQNMNRATFVAGKKVYDKYRDNKFMYSSEL